MAYNPNEKRDAEGKWTDAGNAIRKAASDNKKDRQDIITENLIHELKKVGFEVNGFSTSETDYGKSNYVIASIQGDESYRTFKFRVSDHSVENIGRMQNEFHIHTNSPISAETQIKQKIEEAEKIAFPERFTTADNPYEYKNVTEINASLFNANTDKILSERIAKSGNKHYTIERTIKGIGKKIIRK